MTSNFFYDVYTVFWRDWVVFKKIFFKFLCSRIDYAFFVYFCLWNRLGKKCVCRWRQLFELSYSRHDCA